MAGRKSKSAWEWFRKDRPVFLMVTLFLLLLVYPSFEKMPRAGLLLNALFSLVVISAALAVMRRRWLVVAVCCLGLPMAAVNWARVFAGQGWAPTPAGQLLRIAFLLLVVALLVVNLLTASTVTGNTLCRAVSAYLLIGFAWAGIYRLLMRLQPSALLGLGHDASWGDCAYFSFTALTTLGFGDVTPVSPVARSFVIVESVVGPLYLAILIARLVALYRRTPPGTLG
ncbi:MAG: potassium channel family protein [Planctomycetota bacterium]|jgi:hypothetical protein